MIKHAKSEIMDYGCFSAIVIVLIVVGMAQSL